MIGESLRSDPETGFFKDLPTSGFGFSLMWIPKSLGKGPPTDMLGACGVNQEDVAVLVDGCHGAGDTLFARLLGVLEEVHYIIYITESC